MLIGKILTSQRPGPDPILRTFGGKICWSGAIANGREGAYQSLHALATGLINTPLKQGFNERDVNTTFFDTGSLLNFDMRPWSRWCRIVADFNELYISDLLVLNCLVFLEFLSDLFSV
jgi:hypothetical protein